MVLATACEVLEPRHDALGRLRAWRTCKREFLIQIADAEPRGLDICAADELHNCGAAIRVVRRLGAEYLHAAPDASPADTLWWYGAITDHLDVPPRMAEPCDARGTAGHDPRTRRPPAARTLTVRRPRRVGGGAALPVLLTMDHPVAASAIGNLPSAFAAACRLSRNDAELFERCREALVGRFNSTAIWFDITTPLGAAPARRPRQMDAGRRRGRPDPERRDGGRHQRRAPRWPTPCGASRSRWRTASRWWWSCAACSWSARPRSTTPPSSSARSGRWPACSVRCIPPRKPSS